MRICLIILFTLLGYSLFSQSLCVANECINVPITLNKTVDVNGRSAYINTGTVDGFDNVSVSVFWESSDNVWVLAFDGQPYFQNSCNTVEPSVTPDAMCPWTEVSGFVCSGAIDLSVQASSCEALPVEFISFTGKEVGGAVLLEWITGSEINNKGFYIERSADGRNWQSLGFVSGQGNTTISSSYRFTDENPVPGINYYRLAQVDIDGEKDYSRIIIIETKYPEKIVIRNNPGNGMFSVVIPQEMQVSEIAIYDITGKNILNQKAGSGIQKVDLMRFNSGMYMMQIRGMGVVYKYKLIKN